MFPGVVGGSLRLCSRIYSGEHLLFFAGIKDSCYCKQGSLSQVLLEFIGGLLHDNFFIFRIGVHRHSCFLCCNFIGESGTQTALYGSPSWFGCSQHVHVGTKRIGDDMSIFFFIGSFFFFLPLLVVWLGDHEKISTLFFSFLTVGCWIIGAPLIYFGINT